MAIPGIRFLAFASRWFDPATVARVFEPLVADWQREWIDAAAPERAWIRIRGTAACITAAFVLVPRAMLSAPSPAVARRVIARLIIFSIVMSVPFLVPYFVEMRGMPPLRMATLFWWLLPSAVVIAFPFVMIVIVDAIARHASPTRQERVQTLQFALAAVLLLFVVHGWIMPASNQQYRVGMFEAAYSTAMSLDTTGHPPRRIRELPRGIRELTTYELIVEHARATASEHPLPRDKMLSRELHTRLSFVVLPFVLIWLRWLAVSGRTTRWDKLPSLISIIGLLVAYSAMRQTVDHALNFGPVAGAWFPLLAFWAAGMTALQIRKRLTV